jgi:hypothetical protein
MYEVPNPQSLSYKERGTSHWESAFVPESHFARFSKVKGCLQRQSVLQGASRLGARQQGHALGLPEKAHRIRIK